MTDSTATDYIGFVFGYQNNRRFYLVQWKRTHSNYNVTLNFRSGIKGVQIKVNGYRGQNKRKSSFGKLHRVKTQNIAAVAFIVF